MIITIILIGGLIAYVAYRIGFRLGVEYATTLLDSLIAQDHPHIERQREVAPWQ